MAGRQVNPKQFVDETIRSMLTRIGNLERTYDSGWVALTLINSWTGSLSYRIVGNQVRINGVVSGGTTGNAIAILPTDAFPVGDGGKMPIVAEQGGSIRTGYINVPGGGGSAGQILPTFGTAGSTLSIAGVSLLIN